MPAGDRTGPAGFGPMTGRAAGYCAGYPVPGYANPVGGRGYFGYGRGRRGGGRGWGRGHGYGMGFPYVAPGYPYPGFYGYGYTYPPSQITPDTEMKMLKDQADFMQKEVSAINERIKELEEIASGQKE
jgi:hypothetical protein